MPIEYRPMDRDYVLPVCPMVLLNGPLDRADPVSHASFVTDCPMVNEAFFRRYIEEYGTCAYLAWDRYSLVGATVFFPLTDLPPKAGKVYGIDEYPQRWFDALNKEKGTMMMTCTTVAPQYRDYGIGRKLLESAIGWMKRNRWLRAVKLGVPSELYGFSRHFDLTFWESLGFRVFRIIDRTSAEPWASREKAKLLHSYERGEFLAKGIDFSAVLNERGWQGILGVHDLEMRFG